MFKKPSKTSPSKTDPVDAAGRVLLTVEYKAKNLEQDLKNWKTEFSRILQSFAKLERVVKKEETLKATDLHKELVDTQFKILKLNKDLESSQERFLKTKIEFEKKLLTRFLEGDFNNQAQNAIEEIQTNIKKIQEIFNTLQKSLDETVEMTQQNTKRLADIESTIYQMCLADELSETNKISTKLIERMEVICHETATIHSSSNPTSHTSADSEKINTGLLQLYKAHQTSGKLLDQIQRNLKIQDVALAQQPSAKESEPQIN